MCVHKEQGCPALTPLSRRLPAYAYRDSDRLLVSDCPNPAHIAKQAAHQTLATVLIWLFISRSPLMLNILVQWSEPGTCVAYVLSWCGGPTSAFSAHKSCHLSKRADSHA